MQWSRMPRKKKLTTKAPGLWTRARDIIPEDIEWIWPGRIPKGKLTLLVGHPGIGKSFLLLDIAARVTGGEQWPDLHKTDPGAMAPKGSVLFMTAEDGLADTIIPRLHSARAETSRFHILESVLVKELQEERMFNLTTDLGTLADKIEEVGDVQIIMIDPLTAYLGGGTTDVYRDADTRSLLTPIARLCEDYGVALVGLMHMNKNQEQMAIHRIGGSIAFVAAARAVHAVVKDNDGTHFGAVKLNIAAEPEILDFEITHLDKRGSFVNWLGTRVRGTIAELIEAQAVSPDKKAKVSERDRAKEWLLDFLTESGPTPVGWVEEAAAKEGIAKRTLTRAREEMPMVYTQPKGKGDSRIVTWEIIQLT